MSKQFTLPYEGGLIENNLPAGILHNYEKIWTEIFPEAVPATAAVADIIVSSINACEGRLFRLGNDIAITPKSARRTPPASTTSSAWRNTRPSKYS